MTELIQHKIIRCTDISWMPRCMTCTREFNNQLGEISYRKCGYWVTSCHECFVKNMVQMRDNINEQLESMPDSMRELA